MPSCSGFLIFFLGFRLKPTIMRGLCRGVAQSGSASALGAEGREFESHRPDQIPRFSRNQFESAFGALFLLPRFPDLRCATVPLWLVAGGWFAFRKGVESALVRGAVGGACPCRWWLVQMALEKRSTAHPDWYRPSHATGATRPGVPKGCGKTGACAQGGVRMGLRQPAVPAWVPDLGCAGAPGGTRTPDLLLRRQLLYPVELRAPA